MYDKDLLKQHLVRDEGLKLEAYKDSEGYWTIGIGHLLGTVKTINTINEEQCWKFFEKDIEKAEDNLDRIVPYWKDLDDTRQLVLMNMSFNLGGKLGQFKKFLNALNNSNWEQAAIEMKNSKWYKQTGDRAKRLCLLMRDGDGDDV